MEIVFYRREHGAERLAAEAELILDDLFEITGYSIVTKAPIYSETPLKGLKLVGISIWKGKTNEDDYYATVPARAFGSGSERRYFDFLRPVDHGQGSIRHFKSWLIARYKEALKAGLIIDPEKVAVFEKDAKEGV